MRNQVLSKVSYRVAKILALTLIQQSVVTPPGLIVPTTNHKHDLPIVVVSE